MGFWGFGVLGFCFLKERKKERKRENVLSKEISCVFKARSINR